MNIWICLYFTNFGEFKMAVLLISYAFYFSKERKSLKNDIFRFDFFFNVFRFLEK